MEQRRRPLRICLDARLVSGRSGGVEQAIISLAHGLSQLEGEEESYYFLTYANHQDWIRPYLSGAARILVDPTVVNIASRNWKGILLQKFPRLNIARKFLKKTPRSIHLPRSNGTIEKAGIHLMHFTKQSAFLTRVPSLYHPWDLLHRHFPENFTAGEVAYRDTSYRAFCHRAARIVVASHWVREDLERQFQTPAENIAVIPFGPPLGAYPPVTNGDLAAAQRKFSLPENFVFYPAQPYPHKNHLALLEALAFLRDEENLEIPLVCTGKPNDFYYANIYPYLEARKLRSQVFFLGFIAPLEVKSLYHLARLLVFPSKFEGWGLPVLEAFQAGLPVAAARATAIPEAAGDAALLFDPYDPRQIADALRTMWYDAPSRTRLVKLGRERAEAFSALKTAASFRELYRLLGRDLAGTRA